MRLGFPQPCLDVYKRQELGEHYHGQRLQASFLCFRCPGCFLLLERLIPVSYTHLDVYKRQVAESCNSFRKHNSNLLSF